VMASSAAGPSVPALDRAALLDTPMEYHCEN
jgi:hypothetical protein